MHESDQLAAVPSLGVAVALEQFDRIVDDVFDVGCVAHGERGEFFERHALADERASSDEHVDCVSGEPLLVAVTDGGEQASADDDVDDELGHVGPTGELTPVEIRVDGILIGKFDEQPGCVGCRQVANLGETEALLGEALDLADAVEMPVVVEDAPSFPTWCVQQILTLVIAHRVDGDARSIGEFLDEILHSDDAIRQ